MKKNIVGHMMMPKTSKKTIWERLDLLPRLLCLLLALVIWLLVVNTSRSEQPASDSATQTVTQTVESETAL